MLNGNGNALAAAGAPLPKRFGEFFWGNGVVVSNWYPGRRPAPPGSSRRC